MSAFCFKVSTGLRRAGVFALLLVIAVRCAAADPATDFNAANQAYEQGHFAQAAGLYRSAITNGGATANAWFNLGNAEFKAERYGQAIAAWRSVERLTPRDPALRANLAFARKRVGGEHAGDAWWRQALRYMTPNEWAVGASIALAALFVLLAWKQMRPQFKAPVLTGSLGTAALFLWSVTVIATIDHRRSEAVVAVKQATARFGPLEDSQTAFQLNDGAEVAVLDETPGWVEVRTGGEKTGWVKRESLAFISPTPR